MNAGGLPDVGAGDACPAWFTARIVLQCRIAGKHGKPATFEERLILVQAENERVAWQKAKSFGVRTREAYENTYGQTVTWTLYSVLEVREVPRWPVEDGSELYGAFHGKKGLKRLKRLVKAKGIE